MKRFVVCCITWLIVFIYSYLTLKISDGFFGPFKVIFCDQDKCSFRFFSIKRVLIEMFSYHQYLTLLILSAAFFSTLFCIYFFKTGRRADGD